MGLFFMATASHLPLNLAPDYSGMTMFIVLGIIIIGVEVNGIIGKTGPFTTVKGVIGCGFGLTAVLYGAIEILA